MACHTPIVIKTGVGNIYVACRQCLSCRIRRQSALSLRALFEARTSLSADFWTLTYAMSPEALDYGDFSKFLKRLRKWNVEKGNLVPIRYLGVGEYGSKSGRPHFHALIFNSLSPLGEALHTRLWPHGFVYIGTVTPASVRYTARYCLKFEAKGREGVAHWSSKPTLGEPGMRELAAYMRMRGDNLSEAPILLRIEGHNYQLDNTMREVFEDEFNNGGEFKKRSLLTCHDEYVLRLRYGDPIAAQRRKDEVRQQFFESARFVHEKL